MNRLEKYIVDDLVKNTDIDYEWGWMLPPFLYFKTPITYLTIISSSPSISLFTKYVRNRYAVKDDEVNYIWEQYRETIENMVKENKDRIKNGTTPITNKI